MKILPGLLLSVFISFSSFGDSYILFRENDKIGIKDDAGKILIPASFDGLGWSDGSFSVISGVTGYKVKDHWGLINLKSEFICKADFESITYPGGDRVVVRKKINAIQTSVGCLSLRGEVVVPFIYDGIEIMGLRAVVFIKQKTKYVFGLIDLNGKEIIPLRYVAIRPLGTLRYAVENTEHKTALFSDEGKTVTDFSIDSISSFRSSLAVTYEGQKQGLINRDGEIKLAPIYREVRIDPDGTASVRMPDEWKVLNGENKEIRKIEADQLIPLRKDLYHIVQGNSHGIVDRDFQIVVPLEYSFLGSLSEGKLIAAKKGKFGIVRLNGSVVIPIQFDALLLEGKTARVKTVLMGKSSWSLYDTFGICKTQKEFDFLDSFNGKFYPALKNGYWGGVDRYGQTSIQCVFDSLLQTFDDNIVVKFRGAYGVITTSEKWLLTPQPLRIRLCAPDRYSVTIGKMVFLRDFAGRDIYFTENKLEFKNHEMLETSPDGSQKSIDYDGRIIQRSAPPADEKTEMIFPESEGLRGILKDGKYGFVDVRGRLRIANRYDGIGSFTEGLAAVKILGKWGYLNPSDKIVVQPVYDEANEFSKGRALVRRSGKYGIIEKEGKPLLALRYDSIGQLVDGNFLLKIGSSYGLADKKGQVLLDVKYDRIENLNNGYCLIHRNGKAGLLTLQGLSTIPLIYDQLVYDREKNEYLGLLPASWKTVTIN
jgi:hypothetical protein